MITFLFGELRGDSPFKRVCWAASVISGRRCELSVAGRQNLVAIGARPTFYTPLCIVVRGGLRDLPIMCLGSPVNARRQVWRMTPSTSSTWQFEGLPWVNM